MTIQDAVKKYGANRVAFKLVNRQIAIVCGMYLDDLPDCEEIWEVIEKVECLLSDYDSNKEKILEELDKIDISFLELL